MSLFPGVCSMASEPTNRFFDQAALDILLNPQRWRLIMPDAKQPPNERPSPGCARKFRQWTRGHRHIHAFYEAFITIKGVSLYGVGDQIFLCRPGTMVVIPPRLAHTSKYVPSDSRLHHVWISFITAGQAFMQNMLIEKGRMRRLNDERNMLSVDVPGLLLQELQTMEKSGLPAQAGRRHLLLLAFFADLINRMVEAGYGAAEMIDVELIRKQKIAMICAQLQESGGLHASLSALSATVGYSSCHCARLFKEITGRTFHAQVDVCRIELAKKMLSENKPHKMIAETMGFSGPATFSRWLQKYRRALDLQPPQQG